MTAQLLIKLYKFSESIFFLKKSEEIINELVKYNIEGETHPRILEYLENK